MKSPANGVPPAERSAASAYQPSGSAGCRPGCRIRSRRSTSIDSPCAPATPSRVRRNDESEDDQAEQEAPIADGGDDPRPEGRLLGDGRPRAAPARRPRTTAAAAGPSSRLPSTSGTHQHGERHDVRRRRRPPRRSPSAEQDERGRAPRCPRRRRGGRTGARVCHGGATSPDRARGELDVEAVIGRPVLRSGTWCAHCTARDRNRGWQSGTRTGCGPPAPRCAPRVPHTWQGSPVAAVDVDLAAVVVARGGAAHRLGRVLGRGRCRSGRCARRRPSARPGRPTSRATGRAAACCPGAAGHAVPEQHLGAVDVADAGEHRLVHQQAADRRPAAADPLPGPRPGRRPRAAGPGRAGRRAPSRCSRVTGRRRWRRAGRRTTRGPAPASAWTSRSRTWPTGAGTPSASRARRTCRRGRGGRARTVVRRSRRTGACRTTRRRRAPGRRAARRSRRSGPAGCSTRTGGRRRRRRASPASRRRVCPSGIRSRGCRPAGGLGQRRQVAGALVAASCPIRRTCRSSPVNGVARKTSTKRVMSSTECIRPPTETTLASLCSRARLAVSSDQASAQRTPATLLAAICSPLPEPPMTTPRLSSPARGRRRRPRRPAGRRPGSRRGRRRRTGRGRRARGRGR